MIILIEFSEKKIYEIRDKSDTAITSVKFQPTNFLNYTVRQKNCTILFLQ